MLRDRLCLARLPLVILVLATPAGAWAQALPSFAPLNPISSSRSGLYYQPLRESAPGRWVSTMGLDYASIIENNQTPEADYVLDSEVLRMSLGLSRDLGARSFLMLEASVGGAYAGFMDGFLDWYHGLLGIRMSQRESRPRDRFLYEIGLPDGRTVQRSQNSLFLDDLRVGLGFRPSSGLQTAVSLTLPTSTGPVGYGRGVPSLSLLNTVGALLNPRVHYEGSLGLGFTPTNGSLASLQRELFVAVTSGVRVMVWERNSLFANLFYHSPYYQGTTLPSLDRRELSLDFGWVLQTRTGGEWRVGMTEDLEPGGPGVDLVFRLGRTF
ncbi:MAG TPA: DUF3187 family protein [Gemmatimonadales bacterium]|nr:DUF3187 family protein [Gemmatimonadales bacterium]